MSDNYLTPRCCPICGKPLTDIQIKRGRTYCSRECSHKDSNIQKRVRETFLRKYGVEHPSKKKEFIEKAKQTCLERYGSRSIQKLDWVKEKKRQTSLKHFGVDNPLKSEEIKNKVKESCLKKYGTECSFQAEEVKKKIVESNLERYGVEYPMQSEEIKEKGKQTCLEKYGVEYIASSKEHREARKQTNLEKYGCAYPGFQNEEIRKEGLVTHRLTYFPILREYLVKKNIEIISDASEFVDNGILRLKCLVCGNTWEEQYKSKGSQRIFCRNCAKNPYSEKEKDFLTFLKSIFNGEVIENSRKILDGKELDAYIPEKNLAFEFDGNYWHSTEFKDRTYHIEKTLDCKEKGIRLIHIFEYEWDTKKDKIQSLVKSALGCFDVSLYARECEVKEIDNKTYGVFLEEHHLQGKVNSSIRFGLYHNDELVSVIGFGKSRFKKGEVELHRYCVKSGYKVVGGFSKLIKHSGIESFISYVDLAHFDGRGYEAIGFKEIGLTEPNYVYVRGNSVLTRMQCQKHKLPELLKEAFDENLSESENMSMNGWDKIYDCGNMKLVYG